MRLRRLICYAMCLLFLTPVFLFPGAAGAVAVQAVLVNPATVAAAPSSDDFSACTLNTGLWTFTNPAGDGSFRLSGEGLQLVVPPTGDHNLWEDNKAVLRLTQAVDNADFAVETVFESSVEQRFQTQGVIIQQNETNFLRFDYFHDGTTVRAYAATFSNNAPTVRRSTPITAPVGIDMHLSITRTGNTWNAQFRSENSNAWRVNVSFEHEIAVSAVGVFAGNVAPNEDTPPPAFTATVDYFFNSLAPIAPEDATTHTLTLRITGEGVGTVSATPPGPTYPCDQPIQLVATPNVGSLFFGWSGALTNRTSPDTMTIAQGEVVTATFILGQLTPGSHLPLIRKE